MSLKYIENKYCIYNEIHKALKILNKALIIRI